ncbi:hypothetical protein [Arthrobacter sp. JSM 101049]|uniref:hypothetical protein n=1 Tax=Arthrobacter sp. JSM 101049 TaxID=929097 RepID=UPI003562AA18
MKRFNVFALLIDQYRYIRNTSSKRAAVMTRLILICCAPVLAWVSWAQGWQLQSVGELIGALGLLAGVFISAYAIVFGLRVTQGRRPTSNLKLKVAHSMDEAALTLLSTGLLAGIDAGFLAVVSAMTPEGSSVGVGMTAAASGLSSLVGLYFLMSVRRLHMLYVEAFPPYWRVRAMVGHEEQSEQKPSHH